MRILFNAHLTASSTLSNDVAMVFLVHPNLSKIHGCHLDSTSNCGKLIIGTLPPPST